MTWEVDLHFFLKRALALNYAWGTPTVHRETVMERMDRKDGTGCDVCGEVS